MLCVCHYIIVTALRIESLAWFLFIKKKKKHPSGVMCSAWDGKILKKLQGKRADSILVFVFFFFPPLWSDQGVHAGSSACFSWGYHTGSPVLKGLLQLPQPSPWQHHPLCLQLAFSPSLISSMVYSGLQGALKDRRTNTEKVFSGVIYFSPGYFRWRALYCILTIMQVCIIWAYKPNQVESIWINYLAFMKPFALLYCSALLCK